MNKRENIQETERLAIRKLTHDDFETLIAIMGKPEVMYAWEHGFSEDDVILDRATAYTIYKRRHRIFCRRVKGERTTDRPGRTYENNNERE